MIKKLLEKIYGKRINLDEIERLVKADYPEIDVAATGEDDHLVVYITDEAIYALRFILSRDIAALYSFDISINTCDEIESLMDEYLKLHADRHFKSLDILNTLL